MMIRHQMMLKTQSIQKSVSKSDAKEMNIAKISFMPMFELNSFSENDIQIVCLSEELMHVDDCLAFECPIGSMRW